jgi:hypothetical protein
MYYQQFKGRCTRYALAHDKEGATRKLNMVQVSHFNIAARNSVFEERWDTIRPYGMSQSDRKHLAVPTACCEPQAKMALIAER